MKPLALAFVLISLLLPAGASAGGFAGWSTVQTAHFVFVYEKRDQPTVDTLLSFAEEVYTQVTNSLGSYPKKIWVVVDGRVDTADGAFVPLPPHLLLYVTPPSVPILGSKEREYLRLLLTHELTHYVHLDYDRGFFAILFHVFGPGVKVGDAAFLPGWMTEGIAVNNETLFTTGGRGRDPFFEMVYRALILDNRFFSLGRAGYGSAFPPRGRIYVGGYLMVHYLLEHYGPETFKKIQEQYVRFPFLGPWAAIKKVTGESADLIYSDMQLELHQKYAKLRSIPAGTLVSPQKIGDYYLPVPTQRGWYLYRSNLDSAPAIVRFDPTTKRETVLLDTSLTDYTSFTAGADGRRIVFATFDVTLGRAGTAYTSDLFAFDTQSGATRRITRAAHAWQPALSPDGRILVAVQRDHSYSRLVLVDEHSGSVTPLFAEPDTTVYNPTFSPNGRLLAFALNDHGRQRIMLLEVRPAIETAVHGDARNDDAVNVDLARPLPDLPAANAFFPHFAGDNHVLFSADLGEGLALYEAPTSTSGDGLFRVAEDPVGVARGMLLGDKVLYSSYSPNGYVLRERPLARKEVATPANMKPRFQNNAAMRESEGSGSGASLRPFLDPSATEQPAKVALSGRYVDLPRFLFWLPLPFYDYPYLTSGDLPFGLGLISYGSSLLGRNSYTAALTFRTDIFQPALNLALTSTIGTTTLAYEFVEGYTGTSSAGYSQSVAQSLGLTIPILAHYLMGVTTNLSLLPGLSDRVDIGNGRPFSFSTPFGAPASFASRHAYSLNLGLSFIRIRQGAPRDIVAPDDLQLSLQGQLYPALFSDHSPGGNSVLRGSIAFPAIAAHQVVRLGLATSYSTFTSTKPSAPLIDPRGLFIPTDPASSDPIAGQRTPARSVVGADYLSTLALLDIPLPFGFNLQGIAAGVHLEAAADWDAQDGLFAPDPYLYAGVELISLVGYYGDGRTLPVGIGVSFRFSPTFARPFEPLHDIGPYIFIGTNSFQTSTSGIASLLAPLVGVRAQPRVDF